MAKILFIMTGASEWTLNDGTTHTTGYWAEEAVVPLDAFKAAGHRVEVATPGGVVPPVDPVSLEPDAAGGPEPAARYRDAVATAPELAAPLDLADVDLADYDAVYVPGGHGPMEDLAVDERAGVILADALASGKPVGLVCHGLAALLPATEPDGGNAFAAYRITGFTDREERLGAFADRAPWLLQTRLEAAGLHFEAAEPFTPHVVVDRTVVTGQNPQSSHQAADELLKLIG
ncbi:type 1 glutamine amidotransferase domain-containing protein [Glycomyces terrestris]|uniref:Type 1 glutamine amidotransferase domain-containing protein n=1 Tax=Glycomyces terrestris TaxID=2493553 RepID=A0A426UWM5_9ACTN|nr:type 1 glutamine amidotransferase domain-containing protein [Glycomyces terrestris]RRR98609.1 type 1 glutamine amidotransferase domain-containing protein [Glycomyces terrestris]